MTTSSLLLKEVNLARTGQWVWPAPQRAISPCPMALFSVIIFSYTRNWPPANQHSALPSVLLHTAIDGWYNYTQCHLAKWLCNSNEFLFKQPLVIVWKCKTGRGPVNRPDDAHSHSFTKLITPRLRRTIV